MTDPTPQAVSVCAYCGKTAAEHTDNPADYSNCGDFEPSPAPQAPEPPLEEDRRPCVLSDNGKWCYVHHCYPSTCKELGLPVVPAPGPAPQGEIPTAETAYEKLIEGWKGVYQDTVLQLRASEAALTAAREERDLWEKRSHEWFEKYSTTLDWGCREHDIVARIWAIFGTPSYEELKGRSIYDLINALREELDRAIQQRDQYLEERQAATHDYMAAIGERDRAQEALTYIERQIPNGISIVAIALAASKADRQPEGEIK